MDSITLLLIFLGGLGFFPVMLIILSLYAWSRKRAGHPIILMGKEIV